MINDNDLIKHGSEDQQRDFEDKVERLQPDDLAAIAQRLGLEMDGNEPWQTFVRAFREESWKDFTEAYEHVTYRSY